ncbi:MAG: 30S ribosomal protein S6 [Thermomicrobiales bacterium]|nr:30S ribosomal protein S6 [Thermomicrobiales bacterium]
MDKSQYIQPRAYELMAILLPDQPEAETQAAVEALVGYISEQNGTIDSLSTDSPWGRRRLAYTIRHEGVDYRDGYYVLAYFTTLPSTLSDIERELKLDTNVIRYLLLSYDENMGEQTVEGEEVAEALDESEDIAEEAADEVEAVEEATEEVIAEAEEAVADEEVEEAEEAPAE